MILREPLLPRAWEDTAGVRSSVGWWIAAVICGATLGTIAYFIAPDGAMALFTLGGIVIGFFAPYLAALAWGMFRVATRPPEDWTASARVVRRSRL